MRTRMSVKRWIRTNLWAFNDDEGISTTVPMNSQDSGSKDAGATFDLKSQIPDDLQDKEYFKNVLGSAEPVKELVTQFHNVQQLIGKKSGVPGADAPVEDWDKFHESIRPKTLDEYELKAFTHDENDEVDKQVVEFLKTQRGDDFEKGIKEMMHKRGLTKRQAEGLWEDYEARNFQTIKDHLKKQAEDKKALDDNFDDLVAKKFGGDKDKALKTGENFLKSLVDVTAHGITQLPNELLVLFAEAAVNHAKKYDNQDTVITDPSKSISNDTSYEGLRATLHGLMKNEAYNNTFHAEHKGVREQAEAISKKLADLSKVK